MVPLVQVGNERQSIRMLWHRDSFSRHSVTIMVDEYNSSQKCPKRHDRVNESKNPNCVHDEHEQFLVKEIYRTDEYALHCSRSALGSKLDEVD